MSVPALDPTKRDIFGRILEVAAARREVNEARAQVARTMARERERARRDSRAWLFTDELLRAAQKSANGHCK